MASVLRDSYAEMTTEQCLAVAASPSNHSLSDDDERRLIRKPRLAPSPRNNFPSYSNDDVSVRFRVSSVGSFVSRRVSYAPSS